MQGRTTERSVPCPTCGKTFARSDTLLRHQKSHHNTEDRGPLHRVTETTFRACAACAQARCRCSGGAPCGRCKIRSIECIYPKRRRKATTEGTIEGSTDGSNVLQHSQIETGNSPDLGRTPFLQSLPQYSPTGSQHQIGHLQTHVFHQKPELLGYIRDLSTVSIKSLPQTSLLGHPERDEINDHQKHVSYPITNSHVSPFSEDMQNTPFESHVEPVTDLLQTHYIQTAAASHLPTGLDEHVPSFTFDMNWIPLSVNPSPYGDLEDDFSSLFPPMSDTASLAKDFGTPAFDQTASQIVHQPMLDAQMPPQTTENLPPSLHGFSQSPASSTSEGGTSYRASRSDFTNSEYKKKRRRVSHVTDSFSQPRIERSGYAFPETVDSILPKSVHHQSRCTQTKYSIITTCFKQLCVTQISGGSFTSSHFPRITSFNACIDLYFEHFHTMFPILHAPAFGSQTHWLVLLAVAAIGSTFAKIHNAVEVKEAFQEFLRRSTSHCIENDDVADLSLSIAQARVLNLVCLTQSEKPQIRKMVPRQHVELSRWCLESGLLQMSATYEEAPVPPNSNKDYVLWSSWQRWVQEETRHRLGYFIWLLDCSLGYLANVRPLCNMDDARSPLPCPEALWEAGSPQAWMVLRAKTPPIPSLCQALENLYNKRHIDPGMSEIFHIILINGLFSRTWEVGTHIKQPLSEWKLTGNTRGFLNTPAKDNFWLPLYPLYANWRNSACDCLDVLHWHATGLIAKASGAEHAVVLHLHLARIILLTPFQEVQDLLFFMINRNVGRDAKASFYVHDGSYQTRRKDKLAQIRRITWRWLREDQHKARLAVVHAGSVFWYVKRYSKGSMYEPIAVYLATIVLWVYGSFKSSALEKDSTNAVSSTPHKSNEGPADSIDSHVQPSRFDFPVGKFSDTSKGKGRLRSSPDITTRSTPARSHVSSNAPDGAQRSDRNGNNPTQSLSDLDSEEESDVESDNESTVSSSDHPTFIHLDRPCDDEIVHHFVRDGYHMAGYMSNVDVCQTPIKVLLDGAKLLKNKLSCWGVSREYYDILIRLAEVKGVREGHAGVAESGNADMAGTSTV